MKDYSLKPTLTTAGPSVNAPPYVGIGRAIIRAVTALFAPRSTLAFLSVLLQRSFETARRPVRRNVRDAWKLRLDLGSMLTKTYRGLREVLVDPPSPRYEVRTFKTQLPGPRPRLLHIIPNVFVGGSTQLLVDIHQHLGHAYDMNVLTAAIPPGGPHRGMIIHRIRLTDPKERFERVIEEIAPDFIHIHYWGSTDDPWYDSAFDAAFNFRVPIVQNVNTPVRPRHDERIAATVFVSHYVLEQFGPDTPNSHVIYPGIDLTAFGAVATPIDGASDTALMVYRLERDKLDEDAIEPLVEAVRLRPRTRVVVVGEGPLLPVFLERVAAAGCRQNFDFRGYVPYRDLPAVYAESRIFVAPVARESFGQVVPFAMSMGLAVVGNRVGALPEVLGSAETLGRTTEETGAILARLLDDEPTLARLGHANRVRAKAFAMEQMIESYQSTYSRVLDPGRAK